MLPRSRPATFIGSVQDGTVFQTHYAKKQSRLLMYIGYASENLPAAVVSADRRYAMKSEKPTHPRRVLFNLPRQEGRNRSRCIRLTKVSSFGQMKLL